MKRRSKTLNGRTFRPVGDHYWMDGGTVITRDDWEKPERRWRVHWTDFFSQKHVVIRPTWAEVKAAVERGDLC